MLWLLQNNYVENMTGRLAWALQRSGRRMHDFSLVPGEPLPTFPCAAGEPHFFYGSTGLLRRLRELPQWAVCLFGDGSSLDQRHWQAHRPQDLLNSAVEFITLDTLRARASQADFFVRPVLDQKAFPGQVIRNADLAGLFRGRKGELREHPADLLLAVSPVIDDIQAEYRFVVLNHQVRLGSRYRLAGRLDVSSDIPASVQAAAQGLADGWMPADFIVMDVAVLADGSARLIEFNAVHSSGLYDIRGEDFADVVEEAVRNRRPAAPIL